MLNQNLSARDVGVALPGLPSARRRDAHAAASCIARGAYSRALRDAAFRTPRPLSPRAPTRSPPRPLRHAHWSTARTWAPARAPPRAAWQPRAPPALAPERRSCSPRRKIGADRGVLPPCRRETSSGRSPPLATSSGGRSRERDRLLPHASASRRDEPARRAGLLDNWARQHAAGRSSPALRIVLAPALHAATSVRRNVLGLLGRGSPLRRRRQERPAPRAAARAIGGRSPARSR